MYKRNELYQRIADGKLTPERLVDIILSQQEEIKQLRDGIDRRNNPNEIKTNVNCRIAIIHEDRLIKSFSLSLNTIPNINDKLTINTDNSNAIFKVIDVVKDISIRKNKVTEMNIIYVEGITT